MSEALRLTVETPTGTVLDVGRVAWVRAQLADGAPISIYPGHAPLLAETTAGPLRYAGSAGERTIDLTAGILDVGQDGVTLFVLEREPADDPVVDEGVEAARRFDRLAQALLDILPAQPVSPQDGADGWGDRMEGRS